MPSTAETGKPPGLQVMIEGSMIRVATPEGATMSMPLKAVFEKATERQAVVDGMVLPDGVKMVISRGSVMIWVHQSPPCVRRLRWIAADSPAPFGPESTYRDVTIALPYVIVLAVFAPRPSGRLSLSDSNEAFFRNEPLTSIDDELCYPALLNCSKFHQPERHPLAWICTQYLDRSFERERDNSKRLCLGVKALDSCLYGTGFNHSSEHHELSSWFTESRAVDERIASIEAWEDASKADPLFPIEVPWLATGRSLREVAERIFKRNKADRMTLDTAESVARFVMNHADGNAAPPVRDLFDNLNDPF